MGESLSIVVVGAHPDDCEIFAGGAALQYRAQGHRVTFITTTNGDAGHHAMEREALRRRRYDETRNVARVMDVEYEVMDSSDGRLEPTVANREALIRLLRRYEPDLILTHPPDDYHPDHRYTSQLVADTAYMLAVPLCVPDAAVVRKPVVYAYFNWKPVDGALTVLVGVAAQMDRKLEAVHQNTSQMYEWLPWVDGISPAEVPAKEANRPAFLQRRLDPLLTAPARAYRDRLKKHSKSPTAKAVYVEAFTASPYGTPLTADNADRYFPFDDAIVL